jgi:hypothetical protein
MKPYQLIGLLTYAIGRELDILAPVESLLAALFVVGFPAYQYAYELDSHHRSNLSARRSAKRPFKVRLPAANPDR